MEKSTRIGLMAGTITVIYIMAITILGACGVLSFNICALLILSPILGIGVFALVFILIKFIMDFGCGLK